jgi:hypothetical protein
VRFHVWCAFWRLVLNASVDFSCGNATGARNEWALRGFHDRRTGVLLLFRRENYRFRAGKFSVARLRRSGQIPPVTTESSLKVSGFISKNKSSNLKNNYE